jgi:hypothetical protein
MYRPSTYPSSYLFSYLSTYIWDLIFLPIYLYMKPIFPTYLPIYETYFSYLSTYIYETYFPTYLPIYETYFSYLSTYIWDLFFLPIYLYMRPIFPTYLPIYETYFPTELVTKVKPKINSLVIHTHTQNVQSFEQKWSVFGPDSKMSRPKECCVLCPMDQICGWRRRVPTRMEYKKTTTGYCTLSIFELGKGN